jgi:hypothetical protein
MNTSGSGCMSILGDRVSGSNKLTTRYPSTTVSSASPPFWRNDDSRPWRILLREVSCLTLFVVSHFIDHADVGLDVGQKLTELRAGPELLHVIVR